MHQRCPLRGDSILTAIRLGNYSRRLVPVILLHLARARRSGQWVLMAFTGHTRDGLRRS